MINHKNMTILRKATHFDFFNETEQVSVVDKNMLMNNRLYKVKQKEYGEKKFIKP